MITINNKEYNDYLITKNWEKFSIDSKKQEKQGISPTITFNINDEIVIEVELTITKEELKSYEINKEIDIKKDISDILYNNKNGWISLITENYNGKITRINNIDFKLSLQVEQEIKIEDIISLLK